MSTSPAHDGPGRSTLPIVCLLGPFITCYRKWMRRFQWTERRHPGDSDVLLEGVSTAFVQHRECALARARPGRNLHLVGEPGSGRSQLARFLHRHGPRSSRPLIDLGPVDAVVTSADSSGLEALLQRANGGVVLLRGVEKLDARTQRVIAGARAPSTPAPWYWPFGAREGPLLDLQVFTTSTTPFAALEQSGALTTSFAAWLDAREVRVPALRERTGDLSVLLRSLAASLDVAGIRLSPAAIQWLQTHDFPENVRELYERVSRGLERSETGVVQLHHLLSMRAPPASEADGYRRVREGLGHPHNTPSTRAGPRSRVERNREATRPRRSRLSERRRRTQRGPESSRLERERSVSEDHATATASADPSNAPHRSPRRPGAQLGTGSVDECPRICIVRDLERSTRFYTDCVGLLPYDRDACDGLRWVRLQTPVGWPSQPRVWLLSGDLTAPEREALTRQRGFGHMTSGLTLQCSRMRIRMARATAALHGGRVIEQRRASEGGILAVLTDPDGRRVCMTTGPDGPRPAAVALPLPVTPPLPPATASLARAC